MQTREKKMSRLLLAICLVLVLCSMTLVAVAETRIVGQQVFVDDSYSSELLDEGFPYIKVWVYCENGKVGATILDENDNIVSDCSEQILDSSTSQSSHVFWITLSDSYSGPYYLSISNEASGTSTVWFHYTGSNSKG